MSNLDPLILDFLEWLQAEPRLCADVLDVWRTSCPRLTVWEDAADRGFVERVTVPGTGVVVGLTDRGREFLKVQRPSYLPAYRKLHTLAQE